MVERSRSKAQKHAAYMRHYYKNVETPDAREARLTKAKAYRASVAGPRAEANRRYKKAKREWVNDLKAHPCQDCGGSFPACVMDFDHRPGEEKVLPVATMLSDSWGRALILAEIAKCDLVCANCHRIRTATRRL